MDGVATLPLRIVVCGLVAFLACLGAFMALALTGHDTTSLGVFLGTIAGAAGIGVHNERRLRQQDAVIAKIDRQTNGVLDGRIEAGATRAVANVLRVSGYNVPEGI